MSYKLRSYSIVKTCELGKIYVKIIEKLHEKLNLNYSEFTSCGLTIFVKLGVYTTTDNIYVSDTKD